MSERGWTRKFGLGLGLLSVAAAVALILSHRGAGRRALLAYEAELIARGERLSVAEVVPPAGPAYDPAYREFCGAAASLRSRSIQPGSFDFLSYASPGRLRPLTAVTNLAGWGTNVVSWEIWEEELAAVRAPLAAIHGALHWPAPRSGADYRTSFPSGPNFVDKRYAAQWLAGEALAAAHAGNNAEAIEALLALLSLVDLHREDPTIVNQMIRVAIAGLAFDTTCAVLQSSQRTEARLVELESAWQRVELIGHMVDALVVQRASALVVFEEARINGLGSVLSRARVGVPRASSVQSVVDDYVLDPIWTMTWADQDQLLFLQTYQGFLEAVRAARRHQSWRRLSLDLDRVDEAVSQNTTGFARFRRTPGWILLPNYRRALEYVLRNETQRSLCLAALAIRRYELRHGQPPPDLAALTPELLASVPVDSMDGRPLRYRVGADGDWQLYSVGLDGRDDGGESTPAEAWKRYTSIWDGRDAVWPRTTSTAPVPAIPAGEVLSVIRFEAVPLGDAIRALARQLGVEVVFDFSVESELYTPVDLHLEPASASDALSLLLDAHRLVAVRHGTNRPLGVTRR